MLDHMTTMNDTQRQALRAVLEARREQLLSELDEVRQGHAERVSNADNSPQNAFATEANEVAQEAVRDAEARRDHDELVAVRAALQRLDEGSYGACIDCGADIGLQRLQAFPAALRCINCQSKAESAAAAR
ncbi:MAG TPA: conjugal transfer protein TraR [Comamonadaceae bacterium]|jgi:RNA polymerase-binding protein DksA|nr:conjugal transfer protein TraR [Comamonadaceae bacterium]